MDKYRLIDKIKHLDGFTDDEKSALLGLLSSHKKYGLVWEDKPEAVEEKLKEDLPVLTEVKDKAIIKDTDSDHYPNHILIEGDNLHALTVLSYTHSNSIDVIYIDPPYNTGHKDFIYNDQFVDAEDSYKHSKWLSFMHHRLKIARNLLSSKGVIFISIDDNEQANLKLLCDEIFGESNFLGGMIHQRAKGGGQAKYIVKGHDYILVYAKDASKASISRPKVVQQKTYVINGIECLRNDDVIRKTFGKYDKSLGDRRCFYEEIEHYKGATKKKEIDKLIQKGKYVLEPNAYGMHTVVEYLPLSSARSKHYSIIKVLSEEGKKELESMDINNFDYPKPLELIKLLVGSIYQDKVTILDFFAGSGTTLDATMKLNAEDGGHRQCILVTNNENGICEKVTYVRNKKVIEGYTTPKGEQVAGLTHNNLRYYKTDFVPRERTVKNMRDLVNAATDMLCIKENMYKEQTLFGPWDELPQFIARHFTDGVSGEMIIIYDENYIGEIVKAIKTMTFEKPLKVYVFTTDRDPYEDEFDDVLNKVELCALPAAIYDAYVQVIPHPQDKYIKIAVNSNEEDLENWDEDITMEMDLAAEEDHK
jgi:adenine-specific DNA-methyltransferase